MQQLNDKLVSYIRRLLNDGHKPDRIKLVVDTDYKMDIPLEEIQAIEVASTPLPPANITDLSDEHVVLRHQLDSSTEELSTRMADIIEAIQQLKRESDTRGEQIQKFANLTQTQTDFIIELNEEISSMKATLYNEIPPSVVARVWKRALCITGMAFTGLYAWQHPETHTAIWQSQLLPLYQSYLVPLLGSLFL